MWLALALAASLANSVLPLTTLLLHTLTVSAVATGIAWPLGLSVAIVVEEGAFGSLAQQAWRVRLRHLLAIMSGAPSLALGIGLAILLSYLSVANRGFAPSFWQGAVVAVVLLPSSSSHLSLGLGRVPLTIRRASAGLGASRWQSLRLVRLPYVGAQLVGTALLLFSLACGESVVLALVGGPPTCASHLLQSLLKDSLSPPHLPLALPSLMLVGLCLPPTLAARWLRQSAPVSISRLGGYAS
jgi:phosphate transport system permease protein